MRLPKKKDKLELWGGIVMGVLSSCLAVHSLLTELPLRRHDAVAPLWLSWILLLFGILMFSASLRALLRTRKAAKANPQPKPGPYDCPYTDEEIAEAERTMDTLYLREHGELPDKARSDDTKTL